MAVRLYIIEGQRVRFFARGALFGARIALYRAWLKERTRSSSGIFKGSKHEIHTTSRFTRDLHGSGRLRTRTTTVCGCGGRRGPGVRWSRMWVQLRCALTATMTITRTHVHRTATTVRNGFRAGSLSALAHGTAAASTADAASSVVPDSGGVLESTVVQDTVEAMWVAAQR